MARHFAQRSLQAKPQSLLEEPSGLGGRLAAEWIVWLDHRRLRIFHRNGSQDQWFQARLKPMLATALGQVARTSTASATRLSHAGKNHSTRALEPAQHAPTFGRKLGPSSDAVLA